MKEKFLEALCKSRAVRHLSKYRNWDEIKIVKRWYREGKKLKFIKRKYPTEGEFIETEDRAWRRKGGHGVY